MNNIAPTLFPQGKLTLARTVQELRRAASILLETDRERATKLLRTMAETKEPYNRDPRLLIRNTGRVRIRLRQPESTK